MDYAGIDEVINADGLRLILVQGLPSPWGQAAKAMIEHKGLSYIAGPQQPGGANPELVAWSGVNSGPVVAWNDEPPLNRWDDILLLLERLAPATPLVPQDAGERIHMFGLAHEMCGELGFGWNCRLNMTRPKPGEPPAGFAKKYGYNESDGALAIPRVTTFLRHLAITLNAQSQQGSNYLVGASVSAADFYWAAFSNLVALQPPEECPIHPAVRPMFEQVPPEVTAAIDPILIEHRDRIMRAHFKIPMEF